MVCFYRMIPFTLGLFSNRRYSSSETVYCLLWKWYNNSGNIEHSRKQLWFAFQEIVVAGWLSNMPATHVYAYPIDFWLLCRHLCTALPSGGQSGFEPKISGFVKAMIFRLHGLNVNLSANLVLSVPRFFVLSSFPKTWLNSANLGHKNIKCIPNIVHFYVKLNQIFKIILEKWKNLFFENSSSWRGNKKCWSLILYSKSCFAK